MTHHQGTITGWTEPIARLSNPFTIKAVDRGDILRDARQIKSGIFTVLRHWNDQYNWSTDWQSNLTMARLWFDSFIDGTFKEQYAPYVMAVSERNEYDSHVLPPEVRATRIIWMQAASWVWNKEYKQQLQQYRPGLPPIQLVLCDTAPGNDLPIEAARLAVDNNDILGYHPYIAVYKPSNSLKRFMTISGPAFHLPSPGAPENYANRDMDSDWLYQVDTGNESLRSELVPIGERSAEDWRHVSGRWNFMEQTWGLKPKWIFTEAGPIRDHTGTLALDPLGGWRVLGDRDNYKRLMTSWLRDVQQTAAYREGRLLGYHLFTVPGAGAWQYFNHDKDDYNAMIDVINAEWKPGSTPPPPTYPPRTYKRLCHLVPQDATSAEYTRVTNEARERRQTVLFSIDDAFIPHDNLTERRAIVWGDIRRHGAFRSRAEFEAWVAHYYGPLPIIEYRQF